MWHAARLSGIRAAQLVTHAGRGRRINHLWGVAAFHRWTHLPSLTPCVGFLDVEHDIAVELGLTLLIKTIQGCWKNTGGPP